MRKCPRCRGSGAMVAKCTTCQGRRQVFSPERAGETLRTFLETAEPTLASAYGPLGNYLLEPTAVVPVSEIRTHGPRGKNAAELEKAWKEREKIRIITRIDSLLEQASELRGRIDARVLSKARNAMEISFVVRRKLDPESFPIAESTSAGIYEIALSGAYSGELAMLACKSTRFTSTGRASLWVYDRGEISVTMTTGFESKARLYVEIPDSIVGSISGQLNIRNQVNSLDLEAEELQRSLEELETKFKAASAAETVGFGALRAKAEKCDAPSQFELANALLCGLGVEKDEAEAARWYYKSALQHYAKAQNMLGICYQYGKGVTKDHAEAMKWFRKAAEQNFALAQYNLAHSYFDRGSVVPWNEKNKAEVEMWYRKAAESDYAEVQTDVGRYFADNKNYGEAVRLYRKAADQNYALAQWHLHSCYEYGEGVEKDKVEAYKWILLATRWDAFSKHLRLVTSLENERVDVRMARQAYRILFGFVSMPEEDPFWLLNCSRLLRGNSEGIAAARRAAFADDRDPPSVPRAFTHGSSSLNSFKNSMTADQIEEGKRRANEWLKQHKL